MTPHALLFTIAAFGISETAYLIRKRKTKDKPFCVLGGECQVVLSSKYNKTFGIHNDILGLLFYLAAAVGTALIVIGVGPLELFDKGIKLMILGGVGMSLFFVYLQWKVIKAWCFWCVMSALTTFLMGFIVLVIPLIL